MKRIVVVGGGIAGLSAAYFLQKRGCAVTLLEATDRLGGKIRSQRLGELLVEHGPDSVFTVKPAALELIDELGMAPEVIEPIQKDFSILVDGKLEAVPRGLVSLMPRSAADLEGASFLSWDAKQRVLEEPTIAQSAGGDESIASFFTRRFGSQFSELVAEPLLAGIHAGDPKRLSMQVLYPNYLAREQKNGSVTGGPAPQPGTRGGFVSLRAGMESLVTGIRARLASVDVRLGRSAPTIDARGSSVHVGEFEADAVVVAVPAKVASGLLRHVAPLASERLLDIRHASSVVVTFAFAEAALPKQIAGSGFLVPYSEDCPLTGCTWSSNKWSSRAPAGVFLARCFMGRVGGLNVDDYPDRALTEMALATLEAIIGTREAPAFESVRRWTEAMPQKELGHTDLLADVESDLEPLPIRLIGGSYRASGIPDCIREGREAAAAIAV